MMESNNSDNKSNEQNNQTISENMYSYRGTNNNNNNVNETGAIRRSIGDQNPNNNIPQINLDNQYEPKYIKNGSNYRNNFPENDNLFNYSWIIVFGSIEIITIVILALLLEHKFQFTKGIDIADYELFRNMNIIVFIGFGMLHSILKMNAWASISINFFLIAISVQLALCFNFIYIKAFKENWDDEYFDFRYIMRAVYVSAAILISFGCVMGKLSMIQYLIMAIFGVCFCSLNYQLCERKLEIIDSGGSLYLHTFGAIFGLAMSTVLFSGKKIKDEIKPFVHLNKSSYFSNITTFIGILFLFIFFPSFNSAIQINNQNSDIKRKIGKINTILALIGSVSGTFITSGFSNNGRYQIDEILYGSISGAILVSGYCSLCFHHWSSMIVGTCGGIITVGLLFKLKSIFQQMAQQDNWRDNQGNIWKGIFNVVLVHGINGFLGSILNIIFVSISKRENIVKYQLFKDIDRSIGVQVGVQVAGIFITLGIAFVGGIATGYLMKRSDCKRFKIYFCDTEFFEIEQNIFDYHEPKNDVYISNNNPSLFGNQMGFSKEKQNSQDIRGSHPSYY